MLFRSRQIVETGTHNELMELQGIYTKLVNAQLEMQRAGGNE